MSEPVCVHGHRSYLCREPDCKRPPEPGGRRETDEPLARALNRVAELEAAVRRALADLRDISGGRVAPGAQPQLRADIEARLARSLKAECGGRGRG